MSVTIQQCNSKYDGLPLLRSELDILSQMLHFLISWEISFLEGRPSYFLSNCAIGVRLVSPSHDLNLSKPVPSLLLLFDEQNETDYWHSIRSCYNSGYTDSFCLHFGRGWSSKHFDVAIPSTSWKSASKVVPHNPDECAWFFLMDISAFCRNKSFGKNDFALI